MTFPWKHAAERFEDPDFDLSRFHHEHGVLVHGGVQLQPAVDAGREETRPGRFQKLSFRMLLACLQTTAGQVRLVYCRQARQQKPSQKESLLSEM